MSPNMDDPHPGRSYAARHRIRQTLDRPLRLTDLAAATDITDARLLWHLRRMASAGEVTLTANGLWQRTAQGAATIGSAPPEPAKRAFPARVIEDFNDAFGEAAEGLFGPHEHQASGEHRTRLSPEQAAEFRDRLLALVDEYFAPGRGDRRGIKYGIHWVLTPIDLHPLEDI